MLQATVADMIWRELSCLDEAFGHDNALLFRWDIVDLAPSRGWTYPDHLRPLRGIRWR